MSKYYKAEDVINTLADQWHFEATMEYPDTAGDIKEWKENARELYADLPTIELSGLIDRRCFVGKWKDHYYPHFEVAGIECNVCGKDVPYWERRYKEPKFCPNCGVRMESDNE